MSENRRDDFDNESTHEGGDSVSPVEDTGKPSVLVPLGQFPVSLGDKLWASLFQNVRTKFELQPSGEDNPWGWEALASALPRLLSCITYTVQRLGFIGLALRCYLQTGDIPKCVLLLAVGFLTQPLAERVLERFELLGGSRTNLPPDN